MGFFRNSYYTNGPGISKEQAKKKSYFEILTRKFWNLVKLNMLYALCVAPVVLLSWLLSVGYGGVEGVLRMVSAALEDGKTVAIPILPFLPWIFSGPLGAGMNYVIRNYCRQEHAFVASDFFENTKKNFKQGIAAGTLGTAIVYLFITTVFFYVRVVPPFAVLGVATILGLLLISTSFYIFPIMITFDMNFFDIIKNAFIFAMAKFPQNVLCALIVLCVHILALWFVPVIWVILMVFILVTWSTFTIDYYTWGVIEEYMLDDNEN